MDEQVYTNYRLALPDDEARGTLVVRDGVIAEVQPGAGGRGEDGAGQWLLPGLIELHTDTLENCAEPRPGVSWPLELAVVHQDQLLTGAGITTACNALAVRDVPQAAPAAARVAALVGAVTDAQAAGRLAADHRLHLRCELTCPAAADILGTYLPHPALALVSLMDHRPGQRQFATRAALDRYYRGKYGLTPDQVDDFLRRGLTEDGEIAANRRRVAALARARGVVLASHDDAATAQVHEAVADGATISEFPTTAAAVSAAAAAGLRVLMGAPNAVLGRSHSGNLATADAGRLDLLSSDYAPHSLLPALFRLARALALPLHRVVRMATAHPAAALALHDRGRLAPGLRADFLTAYDDGVAPRVTAVYVRGRRVA